MKRLTIATVSASTIPEPEHAPLKTIDGLGVFDGDPDSRWAGDTMPEWLIFDLGSKKLISLTKLSFYNWTNGRIYQYSILLSSDMDVWDEVVSNGESLLEEWTINLFEPKAARYIKINFIANNQNPWAGLWEAEFWGKDRPALRPPQSFRTN